MHNFYCFANILCIIPDKSMLTMYPIPKNTLCLTTVTPSAIEDIIERTTAKPRPGLHEINRSFLSDILNLKNFNIPIDNLVS